MKTEIDATRSGRRFAILVTVGPAILLASSWIASGCEASKLAGRHSLAPITLSQENIEHEGLYVARCDNCHDEMPSPAEPYCFSGVSAEEHLAIWEYEMAMSNKDPDFNEASKTLFEMTCVGCHDLPDPSQPGCFSGVSAEDVIPLHVYMENSRRGKEVFEADCRTCHEEIDPSAHDIGFWSTHMCNADEHLSPEDEQRVMLYLSSHVMKESA